MVEAFLLTDLSIIVPAHEEGETILKNLKEACSTLDETLKGHKLDYQIVLVDDGSKDDTYERAMKAAQSNRKIKVVKQEHGGKGSALKNGFNHCKGDLITFMDADLDIHPRQISTFLDYMKKHNADVVVGSKRHPESKLNYPFSRRLLSIGFQIMTSILFNLRVRDTQAGLKLFRSKVLKKVLPKVLVKRYAFDLELLAAAQRHNFKIIEAPIERQWTRISNRIKMIDMWHIFVDTAAIFYRLKIKRWYD